MGWMGYLLVTCLAMICVGILYLHVIQPMLIGFGVLRADDDGVNTYELRYPDAAADYVTHVTDRPASHAPPEPAFERAERPAFVPPVQLVNEGNLTYDDVVRLDTLARLVAAGTIAESTAIVAVYDGKGGVLKVSKGGSAAYEGRRNALRSLAIAYGWRPAPPEPARVTPVAERATAAQFAPQLQRASTPQAEEPAA